MVPVANQELEQLLATFIEIEVPTSDAFLTIRETLTRMGVPSKDYKTLYQSCHILHKRGKYYIVMFKELHKLDGKFSTMDEEDLARRNTIANLLEQWGMVTIKNKDVSSSPILARSGLTVIPFAEKNKWKLQAKYTLGKAGS